MKWKLFLHDWKVNRLLNLSTLLFLTVSAFLAAVFGLLTAELTGSIDRLMEQAQTPDFLQMHAGELNREELADFSRDNPMVKEYQIVDFLNLENGTLLLNGQSLADSTQDNGLCIQGECFDYLLDQENRLPEVNLGEVYVPACYRLEYELQAGEEMQIGTEKLVIAGFIRDSQMNSMMASSKRFLVCAEDYERLEEMGTKEYLIEFLLDEGADVNAFATAYAEAGLPDNGPAVTIPLIRLMNALSDGIMVFIILLVSVLMLGISILCIRFMLFTRLEEDRKEIGMLKAIGVDRRQIRQLYFSRVAALSGVGALGGILAAYLVKRPLTGRMRELYGTSENGIQGFWIAVLCVAVSGAILLWAIGRSLKVLERLSAVEALTGRADQKKRHSWKAYGLVLLVTVAAVFLMSVPQNIGSTISSPHFVNYMGIGDGQIRMDIRQTDDILKKTEATAGLLKRDERVTRYAAFVTRSYRMLLSDGSVSRLNVETGDHTMFPVNYAEGKAPSEAGEIALSYLCAEELGVAVGDRLQLQGSETTQTYRICGIYSDITNGGKTAKAAVAPEEEPVMWSVFYLSLREGTDKKQWLSEYQERLGVEKGIGIKAVDIGAYVTATYGQTIRQVRLAAYVACGMASAVLFLVLFLLVRLRVARERLDLSLKKAIGFTGSELQRSYRVEYLAVVCLGIVLGLLSGQLFGELLAGSFLKSMGAADFHFITDWGRICFEIPVLTLLAAVCAVSLGIRKVSQVKAYECCRGKE